MGIGRSSGTHCVVNGGSSKIMELTGKEIEIIELIGEGLTNKQIGKKVNYSPARIKTRVEQLLNKFEANNRAALVCTYFKMKSEGYF